MPVPRPSKARLRIPNRLACGPARTPYAKGLGTDRSAAAALGGFERFPRWMWRKTEVARWLEWLRAYNARQPDAAQRVGFFGLDLYSLRESMTAVVRYLDREDPAAAARARYACFDDLADHPQAYRPRGDVRLVARLRAQRPAAAHGHVPGRGRDRPDTERWSRSFEARLARQFDAVVHIDTSEALTPLEGAGAPIAAEPADSETYPSGL